MAGAGSAPGFARKVASCLVLYHGLALIYGLIIGGIEMLLDSYPPNVKGRFGVLILGGLGVGVLLTRWGLRLWAGLGSASVITLILALLSLYYVYMEGKWHTGAASLQTAAALLTLLAGVVGLVCSLRTTSARPQASESQRSLSGQRKKT